MRCMLQACIPNLKTAAVRAMLATQKQAFETDAYKERGVSNADAEV